MITVDRDRDLLVVIDVQPTFMPGGELPVADGEAVVPGLNPQRAPRVEHGDRERFEASSPPFGERGRKHSLGLGEIEVGHGLHRVCGGVRDRAVPAADSQA